MNEKKQLFSLLKDVERQLWYVHIISFIQFYLLGIGIFSFLLFLFARWIVIPYPERYLIGGCLCIFVVGCIFFIKFRPRKKQAANIYDEFIAEDRVKTALSFIAEDGEIYQLQRKDAIRLMKEKRNIILKRKKKWIHPQMILCVVVCLGGMILSIVFPNEKMELADKKEKETELVKKTEKKIDQLKKKEKNKTVKKELEKMKQEVKKENKAEEALKKLAKELNQLELKQIKAKEQQQQLNQLRNELNGANLKQLANAIDKKEMKKITEQLEKLKNNWDQLTEQQKQALAKLTNQNELTIEQLAQLEKQLKMAIQLAAQLNDANLSQETIKNIALSLQQDMMKNGILSNEQIALSSNDPLNQMDSDNLVNEDNNGSSDGQSQGQGQGQGQGRGQGQGQGNGQGQGGVGTGQGNGTGLGAGKGQGSRDFLTIPENISGKKNIENDFGRLGQGNSKEQFSGNSPILKGSVRSYEEVFREYEKSFRNSTERVQLPKELESIVKQYFSELDPD